MYSEASGPGRGLVLVDLRCLLPDGAPPGAACGTVSISWPLCAFPHFLPSHEPLVTHGPSTFCSPAEPHALKTWRQRSVPARGIPRAFAPSLQKSQAPRKHRAKSSTARGGPVVPCGQWLRSCLWDSGGVRSYCSQQPRPASPSEMILADPVLSRPAFKHSMVFFK